jgi:hypothetical protein
MRCKVKLEEITKTLNGTSVKFTPVTTGSIENQSFFKYTPYGEIKLGIVNDSVTDKLVVGREYYVDFSEAT